MIIDGQTINFTKFAQGYPYRVVKVSTAKSRLRRIDRDLTMDDLITALTTPHIIDREDDGCVEEDFYEQNPRPELEWSRIAPFNAPCKTCGRYNVEAI